MNDDHINNEPKLVLRSTFSEAPTSDSQNLHSDSPFKTEKTEAHDLAPLYQRVAQIWQTTLELEGLPNLDDDIFALGAGSLAITRMLTAIEKETGKRVDIELFFSNPTLSRLVEALGPSQSEYAGDGLDDPGQFPLNPLTDAQLLQLSSQICGGASNIEDVYPLTPVQQGILFHHRFTTQQDPYLIAARYAFESQERLTAYLAALQAVIDRHDTLRTSFHWKDLPEPVQVVWKKVTLLVEADEMEGECTDVASRFFHKHDPRKKRLDLGGAPLVRVITCHDPVNNRWLMVQLTHHLITDYVSWDAMRHEIGTHLEGQHKSLPKPVQFRGLVRRIRESDSSDTDRQFFSEMLSDFEDATLPFGLSDLRADGAVRTDAQIHLEIGLTQRVRKLARKLEVTTASFFHLAWAMVLDRLSGRSDVAFGTVLSGRLEAGSEPERALGLYVNTLPIRIDVGTGSVTSCLRQTHAKLLQLMQHETAPITLAQSSSGIAAPAPLFSAILNYHNQQAAPHIPKARDTDLFEGIRSLGGEPPQLNWSTAIFRKRRTENGKQATQARRDCLEVTAG